MNVASARSHYRNSCVQGGLDVVSGALLRLVVTVFVALLLTPFGQAQVPAGLRDISRLPSGDFRLRAEPTVPNPDILVLQSSISPAGPYWTVPGQQRGTIPGGYEFIAPYKSYQSRQFYRLGIVGHGDTKPYIRYIAPDDRVKLGQVVTLHGENFATTPVGNTVTFSLLSGLVSQATVISATARQLIFTVPEDLEIPSSDPAIVYRVTVTTAGGTSNGVGCLVRDAQSVPAFALKPVHATLVLPPGSGTETLVIGGGVPPYTLDPLSPQAAIIASAVLEGNLVKLTATPGSSGGIVGVTVHDSEGRESESFVKVRDADFTPNLFAEFHTTLAGAAPGFALHLSSSSTSLSVAHTEISLQGATLEIGHMKPGVIPAFVEYSFPGSVEVSLAHLEITSVERGMAHFDVITMRDGSRKVIGSGSFIAQPPTIVLQATSAPSAVVVPSYNQRILFNDSIVRLPTGVDSPFSLSAAFTSASARRDRLETTQVTRTQDLVTTGTSGPRLESMKPVEAQSSARVKLIGTGMGAGSTVTFTSSSGIVPALVKEVASDGITVLVPEGADVAGPVQVTSGGQQSNPHLFWPRFHGDAVLAFDSFQANVRAPFRLLFQQLPDSFGVEIHIGKIVWTVDRGSFDFSSLVENEQAGTITVSGQTDEFESSLDIWYAGQEAGTNRHEFYSSYNRFFLSNAAGGQGVVIELEQTTPAVRIDLAWICHFTPGLYIPPAAGTTVRTRMEISSRAWRSAAWLPLNIIRNFKQVVAP